MKFDIAKGMKAAKSLITANSPVLLTGASIAGIVATGVLAAKGGYKARGIVDEERMRRVASPEPPFDTFAEYYKTYVEKAPDLTLQEKVKLTWLCYAAPAVTGVTAISSTAGVHLIHTKRHAALAGLYAMTSAKLDDVSEKAEELLGPKKAQELKNEISQKAVDRDGPIVNTEVMITGDGTALTHDQGTGRWFMSSVNKIEAAVNEVNAELANNSGAVCLNDLYDKLGMEPVELGNKVGWSGTLITAKFGEVRASDGQVANSVWFQPAPSFGYNKR